MPLPHIALALRLLQPCADTLAQSARRSHAPLARTGSPQTLGLAPRLFPRTCCTRTAQPHRTSLSICANSTIGNTAVVRADFLATYVGSQRSHLRGGRRALSESHVMPLPHNALALWLLQPCTDTLAQSARRSHARLACTASPQTLGLAPKLCRRPLCTRTAEPHRTPLWICANSTIGNTPGVCADFRTARVGSHRTRLCG
jgi:hypothetical protein